MMHGEKRERRHGQTGEVGGEDRASCAVDVAKARCITTFGLLRNILQFKFNRKDRSKVIL